MGFFDDIGKGLGKVVGAPVQILTGKKEERADPGKAPSLVDRTGRRDEDLKKLREQAGQAFETGQSRVQETLGLTKGPGPGRSVTEGRAPEFQEILDRRRQQLEGFTPEERAAIQSRVLGAIGQTEQQQQRSLRGAQASAGITGGLAGAQQANVLAEGAQARQEAERDLFLQSSALGRQGLGAFEDTATALRRQQLGEGLAQVAGGQAEQALESARQQALFQGELAPFQAQQILAATKTPKREGGILTPVLDSVFGLFGG